MSLILLSMIAAAGAQVAPGQSAPGGLLIDRNRIDRAEPVAPPAPPTATAAPARITDTASGVPIRGIRFIGADAPAAVARAARPFLGKPANTGVLRALATALSNAYADAPVALYTVAIPDQTFANGVVIVSLTEGRIARAQVRSDKAGSHPLLRARMTRLLKEAPLSRATFERQFLLMRAIPGLTITPEFADPGADGALVLTVTPKQKRTKLTAGYSNRGVDVLGDGQFDVRGEAYGIGVDGDQVSIAASAATDLKRFRYVSAGYAAPIGADGLTASGNIAYLETRPRGFPIRGTAKQAGVALGYPLIRGFRRSADVSVGFDGLDSDNAAFGNLIASERTRALRVAGSYADVRPKRSVSLSASLSKGVDVLGARVTAPLAEAGFAKVAGSAGIAQAVGRRAAVRLSASGQYTRDALPAAERFAIGGETIGRAFDTSLLTGDRGAGALTEFAYRPLKAGSLAQSEIYTFIDGGVVRVLPRGILPEQDFSLASTGVGFRAKYRDKAELGLEAARVIDDPFTGYGEDWRFSVAWRLTL